MKKWIIGGALALVILTIGSSWVIDEYVRGPQLETNYVIDTDKEPVRVVVENGQGINAILDKVNGDLAGRLGHNKLYEYCKVVTKDDKILSLNSEGLVEEEGYQPRFFQEGETIVVPVLKEVQIEDED